MRVSTAASAASKKWQPAKDRYFIPGGASNPPPVPLAAARGEGKTVALTFDDGPNPGETADVLDFLGEHGIVATFSVIGENVLAPGGAALLRRIVAEGHVLSNHGTSFADMGSWTFRHVEQDLKSNLSIIREAVGNPSAPVPYFRAPNGNWGKTAEVAAALGMQPLGLGNVIHDWDGNDLSVPTLTANFHAAFTPGAVILAHDGGGDRRNTVTAMKAVVPEKIAAGWTFTLPGVGTAAFTGAVPGQLPRGSSWQRRHQ